MSGALERAAEAAYKRYGFTGDWNAEAEHPSLQGAQHDTKEMFRSVARAVLMAVREIDWELAQNACEPIADTVPFNPPPDEAFKAMIDAILGEGEGE